MVAEELLLFVEGTRLVLKGSRPKQNDGGTKVAREEKQLLGNVQGKVMSGPV